MNSPGVSVVMPLYNKRATVLRSLDSVLAQTFADFEVIVVNDGSSDGGADLAADTGDPRVRVIRQSNCGVSAARNHGIAQASAPLVAFLDADDLWAPEFLAAILELAQAYPDAGMYVTGRRHVNPDGSAIEIWAALPEGRTIGIVPSYFAAPEEFGLAHSSAVALPKAVLESVGGFQEGEHMGEDVDMWVRIAARHPVACHTRVLSTYYDGGAARDFERISRKVLYPPALTSLRSLVEAGGLPPRTLAEIERNVDFGAIQHLCVLVHFELPQAAETLRTERYYCWRFRLEAKLIGAALRFLPAKTVLRLRSIALRIVRKLRRPLAKHGNEIRGRVTVTRAV